MEYYSAIKKKEITPFPAIWMDLEIIILSEVGQREKDKCHMISFICGILKKERNELFCRTDTDFQTLKTSLWLPKGTGDGGWGEGWTGGLGLAYAHCGVWNAGQWGPAAQHRTQYSVMVYVGKESEREWMCYMYNRITLLHSRNYNNIVNQLYFKKTSKKWGKKSSTHPA